MGKEDEKSLLEKLSWFGKTLGILAIAIGAVVGSTAAVSLGAVKTVAGITGEKIFKKKKK